MLFDFKTCSLDIDLSSIEDEEQAVQAIDRAIGILIEAISVMSEIDIAMSNIPIKEVKRLDLWGYADWGLGLLGSVLRLRYELLFKLAEQRGIPISEMLEQRGIPIYDEQDEQAVIPFPNELEPIRPLIIYLQMVGVLDSSYQPVGAEQKNKKAVLAYRIGRAVNKRKEKGLSNYWAVLATLWGCRNLQQTYNKYASQSKKSKPLQEYEEKLECIFNKWDESTISKLLEGISKGDIVKRGI